MERRTVIKSGVFGATAGAASLMADPAMADFDRLPRGRDGFLVFAASGIYDPVAALSGPTGADFDRDVMGRSPAEAEAHRDAALTFFLEEYGLSFAGGLTAPIETIPGFPPTVLPIDDAGRAFLVHTQLTPLADYRALVVGGDNAGQRGFIVHDANYAAVLFSDTTLTGNWGGAGTAASAGSVVVFGEYLIQRRRRPKPGGGLRGYRISWTSFDPITMMPGFSWPENRFLFDCRMHSEDFGDGVALGRNETRLLPDGRVQQLIRNVITFPADEFYANR